MHYKILLNKNGYEYYLTRSGGHSPNLCKVMSKTGKAAISLSLNSITNSNTLHKFLDNFDSYEYLETDDLKNFVNDEVFLRLFP